MNIPVVSGISGLHRLAATDFPILITGPSGTGKSWLARRLHDLSDRSGGPIIVKGCGTFRGDNTVANLFGHTPSAFTGAGDGQEGILRKCDGGTLVLDDVDALSLEDQAALLTWLDDGVITPYGADTPHGRVDVRLIATTNGDIEAAVEMGRFRADLFFRISEFTVDVPNPTKDETLLISFITECEAELGVRRRLDDDAKRMLGLPHWKGHLRELRSVVRQIHVFASETSSGDVCVAEMVKTLSLAPCRVSFFERFRETVRADEHIVRKILDLCDWNKSLCAEVTKLSRPTIYEMISRNGWSPR